LRAAADPDGRLPRARAELARAHAPTDRPWTSRRAPAWPTRGGLRVVIAGGPRRSRGRGAPPPPGDRRPFPGLSLPPPRQPPRPAQLFRGGGRLQEPRRPAFDRQRWDTRRRCCTRDARARLAGAVLDARA